MINAFAICCSDGGEIRYFRLLEHNTPMWVMRDGWLERGLKMTLESAESRILPRHFGGALIEEPNLCTTFELKHEEF